MGKRSRKRTGPGGPVARPATPAPGAGGTPGGRGAVRPDRRSRKLEAPRALWAPLPLGELTILAGMVLIVAGFLVGGDRAGLLLAIGFTLVSVAGLELAVREHVAGYRSHSTLLAGAGAIALIAPLYFLTPVPYEVLLILGVVFFAALFQGLRAVFARKTGGLGFRA